ncbi:MAG TPA: hypothetical protein VNQ76_03190 [Planctomicrobium sp.]|nr:hypothetical protein [Planctomicrobium sp.]
MDFAYSPVREIPAQAMAQEILPRAYYSFKDRSATPKTRYFIAYHIKTGRHQFTFAHEVDRAILEKEGVTIHPLSDEEMQPADQFGHVSTEHSYVYLHKPEGKLSDIVFYLKR